jgi:hypothetical protein
MKKPPSILYGLSIKHIAAICQVSEKTAGRWKAGTACPPKTSLWVLARDLGCFASAWHGWTIRDEELLSPEGWSITRNDVLSAPLLRAQVAVYQAENRTLRGLAEEFSEDQPLPSELTFEMK